MTGQINASFAIMQRAEELGILEKLLSLKNIHNKSVDDLLTFLVSLKDLFKNISDVANPLMDREIEKTIIVYRQPTKFSNRKILLKELQTENDYFKG